MRSSTGRFLGALKENKNEYHQWLKQKKGLLIMNKLKNAIYLNVIKRQLHGNKTYFIKSKNIFIKHLM